MAVATSLGRQRVPMVDASTLDDRTRPVVEPASWMSRRLRYLHWSGWSERIDRPPAPGVRTPGARRPVLDPRAFGPRSYD